MHVCHLDCHEDNQNQAKHAGQYLAEFAFGFTVETTLNKRIAENLISVFRQIALHALADDHLFSLHGDDLSPTLKVGTMCGGLCPLIGCIVCCDTFNSSIGPSPERL